MSEATITLDSREEAVLLYGSRDQYLREIRTTLGMQQLVGRGDQLLLKGTDEQLSIGSLRLMRAEAPVDCTKARREPSCARSPERRCHGYRADRNGQPRIT